MDLFHWQQRDLKTWPTEHHAQEMRLMIFRIFSRVWATAQRFAEDTDADRLVILTACYFHDIVSLAKTIPERSRSSAMAAEKRWLSSSQLSLISRRTLRGGFTPLLKRTVLARRLLREAK